ncbi:hypothetical protein BSKO_08092 [Bryopsis sp. KO-2023]|nr:hypothetical protein BSKO_08092 [Bryopsis sp. KO-2023]
MTRVFLRTCSQGVALGGHQFCGVSSPSTSARRSHIVRDNGRRMGLGRINRTIKPVRFFEKPRCSTTEAAVDAPGFVEETSVEDDPASPIDISSDPQFQRFAELCEVGNLIPMYQRVMSDQLTPVLAYRCLVHEDDREAPSFLFESVINGEQQGRYSFVGAQPSLEIVATGNRVVVLDHMKGTRTVAEEDDPMEVPVRLSANWRPVPVDFLPAVFTGGWVGYTGYDTVRYVYKEKLPFDESPEDDRQLADIHLGLYKDVVVFDNVAKLAYIVSWVHTDSFTTLEEAYSHGCENLERLCNKITKCEVTPFLSGSVDMSLAQRPAPAVSNMTKEEYLEGVETTKEYIEAGDIFQLVFSQRFERRTFADPFEIYRALRVVNPSPYMTYLQARGCIVVASSPEILCRVEESGTVTNRPLAGTRPRGSTEEKDRELEEDLLEDEKEKAEHVMLVDLGRNDVGKVAKHGTVSVDKFMEIERYSHVMHISSTVTGEIKPNLNCWDALRAALPVGTVSGAPKVRAMQIIDELEVHRRGPYGGGVGHVSFTGGMDVALALRTMVIPTASMDTIFKYNDASKARREWVVYIQAGAGLVADSVPETEYEETVNKAAALGRSIDLAESAFVSQDM